MDAVESSGVDRLAALLTGDAWLTVPTEPLEYQGHAAIARFFLIRSYWGVQAARLVPTRANGQPAFGFYVRGRVSLRVLIAGDHAPTREDVRRALEEDERFSVCATAADAPGAVRAAVRDHPDVCVLDIRMPGSGLAAAWEIAARLPQAKIVMLTVSEREADLFAALHAGAEGYLLKTMNLRRLPEALHGVCAGEAAIPGHWSR